MGDSPRHGIQHPLPKRANNFSFSPTTPASASTSSSIDPSPERPPSEPQTSVSLDPRSNNNLDVGGPAPTNVDDPNRGLGGPSGSNPRSRSILNLTSSTLLGIYSPAGYDANREDLSTPWGTGTQTPASRTRNTSVDSKDSRAQVLSRLDTRLAKLNELTEKKPPANIRQGSYQKHHTPRSVGAKYAALIGRTVALFLGGMMYGDVIVRLHDSKNIVPVKIEKIDRGSWLYLVFWGAAGVTLGSVLPWLDDRDWSRQGSVDERRDDGTNKAELSGEESEKEPDDELQNDPRFLSTLGAEWNPIVRTIGAFVGVAFAIVS